MRLTEQCQVISVYKEHGYAYAKGTLNVNILRALVCETRLRAGQ